MAPEPEMVYTPALYVPEIPVGKLAEKAPVPPPEMVYEIGVIAAEGQTDWLSVPSAEDKTCVGLPFITICAFIVHTSVPEVIETVNG